MNRDGTDTSSKGIVIGVGFHKTGTSTLRDALSILGYKVKDTTPRALIPILRGNERRIRQIIGDCSAVEDTPWFMIYKTLDRLYPNSKFILTIRDEDSWFRSISQHIGTLPAAHHEWIYGRGKGIPMKNKQNSIQTYIKHNEGIIDYFKNRPRDLLVINFTKGEGWQELCRFLGHPVPDETFPHANKTINLTEKQKLKQGTFKYMRKYLKNRMKIIFIDIIGLWK